MKSKKKRRSSKCNTDKVCSDESGPRTNHLPRTPHHVHAVAQNHGFVVTEINSRVCIKTQQKNTFPNKLWQHVRGCRMPDWWTAGRSRAGLNSSSVRACVNKELSLWTGGTFTSHALRSFWRSGRVLLSNWWGDWGYSTKSNLRRLPEDQAGDSYILWLEHFYLGTLQPVEVKPLSPFLLGQLVV